MKQNMPSYSFNQLPCRSFSLSPDIKFPSLDNYHYSSSDSMPHSIKRTPSPLELSSPPDRANKVRKANQAMSIASLLSPPKYPPEQNTISLPSLTFSPQSNLQQAGSFHSTPERSLQSHTFGHPHTPIIPLPPVFQHLSPRDPFQPTQRIITNKSHSYKRSLSAETKEITVECFHSSVAQKSYGTEKRFICPPPIVRAIKGYNNHGSALVPNPANINNPIRLSIVSDGVEESLQQESQLEHRPTVFRYLHISNNKKSKQFQLKLDVFNNSHANLAPEASLTTDPIAIVSKPSKSRSLASCIMSGSLVSLYSRINSQTVRTNYFKVNDGKVITFSKSDWSPMRIELAGESLDKDNFNSNKPRPITYGSHVTLSDWDSGFKSETFEILKVERGEVLLDYQGPVLQMHKIALRKAEVKQNVSLLSCDSNDAMCKSNGMVNFSNMKLVNLLSCSSFNCDSEKSIRVEDRDIWTLVGISHSKQSL
ncbi:beta-trefoil [Neoconidiobolus thromboides FSU 785]|nr:beta-trefoil [Neoconidiobolus thromboides FSU 785]